MSAEPPKMIRMIISVYHRLSCFPLKKPQAIPSGSTTQILEQVKMAHSLGGFTSEFDGDYPVRKLLVSTRGYHYLLSVNIHCHFHSSMIRCLDLPMFDGLPPLYPIKPPLKQQQRIYHVSNYIQFYSHYISIISQLISPISININWYNKVLQAFCSG